MTPGERLGARRPPTILTAAHTMRFPRALLVAFSLLLSTGLVQARKAELVDPAPIAIPATLTQAQVVTEIKARTLWAWLGGHRRAAG